MPQKAWPFSVAQKRPALGGTHFCAQPRGRNSFPLISPWGQNSALNRALGLAASHTLSAEFPCRCPACMRMSSRRDFLAICKEHLEKAWPFFAKSATIEKKGPPSRPTPTRRYLYESDQHPVRHRRRGLLRAVRPFGPGRQDRTGHHP